MTPTDLRGLARVLGALLPQRTSGQLAEDPHAAQALAARLETACRTAGLAPRDPGRMAASLLPCHRYLRLGRCGLAQRRLGWPAPSRPASQVSREHGE